MKARLAQILSIVALIASAKIANADTIAYVESSTGQFGTVDLNTGAFTLLGSNGLNAAGLALANGTLYATPDGGTTVYSVDTSNGALTPTAAGSLPVEFAMGENNSSGYYLTTDLHLWSVNFSNGQNGLAVTTNLPQPFGGGVAIVDNPYTSSLYALDAGGLYTLNVMNGQASSIGSTGDSALGAAELDQNGTLWAADSSIYTVDTNTGAATLVAPITGGFSGDVAGLAPVTTTSTGPSSVPEPGSFLLTLGGAALLMFRRRS